MRDPLARAAPIERIRTHLVSLRMPRGLEALDQVVQQLERGQATAIEAIETLLAEELTIREGRRIKAALQIARLTPIKTLSSFDFWRGSDQGNTRSMETFGWCGFGEIRCNPETAFF